MLHQLTVRSIIHSVYSTLLYTRLVYKRLLRVIQVIQVINHAHDHDTSLSKAKPSQGNAIKVQTSPQAPTAYKDKQPNHTPVYKSPSPTT